MTLYATDLGTSPVRTWPFREGVFTFTPLSMTATLMPFPVLTFHICSACIGSRYHCLDWASYAAAPGANPTLTAARAPTTAPTARTRLPGADLWNVARSARRLVADVIVFRVLARTRSVDDRRHITPRPVGQVRLFVFDPVVGTRRSLGVPIVTGSQHGQGRTRDRRRRVSGRCARLPQRSCVRLGLPVTASDAAAPPQGGVALALDLAVDSGAPKTPRCPGRPVGGRELATS